MEAGENFLQTAIRETREEAGIDVELKGILRVEHAPHGKSCAKMRVVFYAEPVNEKQPPKSKADNESLEAKWVTIDEFLSLGNLRGEELVDWGRYLDGGGMIYPLEVFAIECGGIPGPPEGDAGDKKRARLSE